MKVRMPRKEYLLAGFVSCINFLFFLIVHKNFTYHYLYSVSIGKERALFILLKIGFASFALALLSGRKIMKRLPVLTAYRVMGWLAGLIFAVTLINYVKISGMAALFMIVFLVITVPSFLCGLIFSILSQKIPGEYDRMMFCLLMGSSVAVAAYNGLFIYMPFNLSYLILCMALAAVCLLLDRKGRAPLVIASGSLLFFILLRTSVKEIYVPPAFIQVPDPRPEYTVRGPYGILDVLYSRAIDSYVMITDKQSPSIISVKGERRFIDRTATIPYMVRSYGKALVIGSGGGQELAAALLNGVRDITAVEIDAQRVNLMKGKFREYSLGLYDDPAIEVVTDSARAYLKKSRTKYDLIVLHKPWTRNILTSISYDTSGELFTEEALRAYLNALERDGILFFGITDPMSDTQEQVLAPVKAFAEELKGRMLIFLSGKGRKFIYVMISPGYDLEKFRNDHADEYDFVYYPSMHRTGLTGPVAEYLFRSPLKKRRVDRQFLDFYDPERSASRTGIILAAAALLLLTGRINKKYPVFLYLGAGYEIACLFFVMCLLGLVSNAMLFLPRILIAYFFLGSLGYIHSRRAGKRTVIAVCAILVSVFLLIFWKGLYFLGKEPTYPQLAVTLFFFMIAAYLITFPFGYLIRKERDMGTALAVDYIGSGLSIPVIILVPNLDHLLIISVFIYTAVGLMLLASKE